MAKRVRIVSVAGALPETIRSSAEVEAIVSGCGGGFRPRQGVVEALSGIRERRVSAADVQCSDLAVEACRKVLTKAGVNAPDIDLLVFASAGQDLIEPATAHIVQAKLGTSCQVFDIKNACNSFLNGMQIAESLILSGACRMALVAAGEVNSRAVDWKARTLSEFKRNFPGYTMGDAGAAMLLAPATDERGIFFHRFRSVSEHWKLTTLAAGGSMHPRAEEHSYLRTDGTRLKQVFNDAGLPILRLAMQDAGLTFADFRRIFLHQVSVPYLHDMLARTGIPEHLVEMTVVNQGNMAAASIPFAMAQAIERGAVGPGDRVMCLGLASGISIGIVMADL